MFALKSIVTYEAPFWGFFVPQKCSGHGDISESGKNPIAELLEPTIEFAGFRAVGLGTVAPNGDPPLRFILKARTGSPLTIAPR